MLLVALTACTLTPRLPRDVSAAVQRDDMRLLRTQTVDLYYPKHRAREAYALAERAEGCVAALRAMATGRGGLSNQRLELIFADVPFNNAYLAGPQNGDLYSLVPTHWSFDPLLETGIVPNPAYVACHEIVHYIQAQQTLRTLGGLNKAFGPLISPQLGLDSWFWEGLATYYEQRLQPGTGRPAWPAWIGLFHAAVAERRVSGGDFSALNRRVHWGHAYLYGERFIAWLIENHGERRLWQLVELQGRSFFFPFLVNQRFKRVYGKTLSQLIDAFAEDVARRYPPRARPPLQRVIRTVGANGRYARASGGTEALIHEAMDEPTTLTVRGPDGRIRYRKRLVDVLPRRRLVTARSVLVSGLRFSRDNRSLTFVAVDPGAVFQEARLLRLSLVSGALEVVRDDLGGLGGELAADGRTYFFVRVSGAGYALSRIDLLTGEQHDLYRAPPGVYLSSPALSPDGRRLVVNVFEQAHRLAIFDAESGARLRTLALPGQPVVDAIFVDDDRLLFLAPHDGRFQVFIYTLSTRMAVRLTDAPYLVLQPRASGGTIRFLNREGFRYTLDEVPLPPAAGLPAPTHLRGPTGWVDVVHRHEELAERSSGSVEPPLPGSPPAQSLAEAPPPPLPPPVAAPLQLRADEDYAVFPRLLIPSLRVPYFGFATQAAAAIAGIYLGGTDALGKHRWGASLGVQPFRWRLSGGVGYLNAQLSPLLLSVNATQLAYDRAFPDVSEGGATAYRRRRERDLTVRAELALRTTRLALSLHGTEDLRPDEADYLRERTMSGVTLSVDFDAFESTPMSGPRRGYRLSAFASTYPGALGTLSGDLHDLRTELALYAPLPLSRRHTLRIGLRARALLHGEPARLLDVGGSYAGSLFDQPGSVYLSPYPGLPPRRRFHEPLRGFETLPFTVDRIGIVDVRYRYPIIIDRGTATSLWLLPSFFLSQIDVELFASGAAEDIERIRQRGHLAAGGAVTVRFTWWLLPFALQYQLAQRLSDDRALQHLVTFSTDVEL